MRIIFFHFFLIVFCVMTGFSSTSHAEREGGWFRERIKEKIAQKLEDKPAPEINASIDRPVTKPGDYTFAISHDGLTRMYKVHVPPGYDGSRPAPLLFAFHGGGGDMEYMAREEVYGLVSKSDKEGFIVVFPNGYSKFKSGMLATWNAGTCCGDARDRKIDDTGFVRNMVSHITRQMNIDRGKIFATGMSNGGLMSYRLACEMPDVFRAIAPVAGTDNTLACHPSRPVSVLHIHAMDDDHVLFNGGAGPNAFKDMSKVTQFRSVPESIARWIKFNNCNPVARRVLETEGAYCDLYEPCEQGAQVKLCVTETGGHSWPGGSKPGGVKKKGPTSKAISANDEMWEFFQSLK